MDRLIGLQLPHTDTYGRLSGTITVDQTVMVSPAVPVEEDEDSTDPALIESGEKNIEKLVTEMVLSLEEQQEMLNEYFSISLVKDPTKNNRLQLTGLPVLLDGHPPQRQRGKLISLHNIKYQIHI